MEQDKNLLNVQEVSLLIGSSVQTISSWYKFKRENPNDEFVQNLPDFERVGNRRTRYWNREDIWKLIEFKNSIPTGRYGLMGSVTQRYVSEDGYACITVGVPREIKDKLWEIAEKQGKDTRELAKDILVNYCEGK